jgi:hypothetical protein
LTCHALAPPRLRQKALGIRGLEYLAHKGGGVPSNGAIGRYIFQNNRTSGNNDTFANRCSGKNQTAIAIQLPVRIRMGATFSLKFLQIVPRRTKKRPPGDANIWFNCDLRQAENPDIVADPDMVSHDQAPGKGDIYVAAYAYSFPNLRTEGAQ